jgi:DNA-binding transcriptional LysR family regulator
LLRQGARLLQEIDAVANRVKRVATGWEPQISIAVDTIISRSTVMDLVEAFMSLNPPTQLRVRHEVLSGTLNALTSGRADIAIGTNVQGSCRGGPAKPTLGRGHFCVCRGAAPPVGSMHRSPLSDELRHQLPRRGRGGLFGGRLRH